MSLVPSRNNLQTINRGLSLSAINAAVKQVLKTRSNNLSFRQSVVEHERKALSHIGSTHSNPGNSSVNKMSGSKSMKPVNRGDLKQVPFNPLKVPRGVPRNVNTIVWDLVKVNAQIVVSATSGTLAENNTAVSLSTHPQASSWAALFDQYCIPQFSVTFQSQYPTNINAQPGQLYTAIDFDNVSTLGSLSAIEDFSTCIVTTVGLGTVLTRSVKPCVKNQLASSANAGVIRQWVDCGAPTIPHNGIRAIVSSNGAVAYTIFMEITIWYAFKNTI